MSIQLTTSRRRFLLTSGGAAVALSSPIRASAATEPDLAKLAEEATIWGFTLVATGHYVKLAVDRKRRFNQFYINYELPKPSADYAGANPHMLYGMAWIDLSAGPQVLEVPDAHGRYYSIGLADAYQVTFMYVGSRETGTGSGKFVLTPPGWSGSLPEGMVQLKAPTSLIMANLRTLAVSDKDIAPARMIEEHYSLGPLSTYPNGRVFPIGSEEDQLLFPVLDLSKEGAGYFDQLCTLVEKYPPTTYADIGRFKRFEPLGIAPGRTPSQDPKLAPILAAAVPKALAQFDIDAFNVDAGHTWRTNVDVDSYSFNDPYLRTALNIGGPPWPVIQEIMYITATTGADGEPLTGTKRYKITFPKGQRPPVNVFWSIAVYDLDWHLVTNPLNRYDLGSFTRELTTNADGSLDIFVQHHRPSHHSSNWLPAPNGPFRLHARAYGARAPILELDYKWPAIEAI